MKTYLFILKFLFIGALFIISNNNLHLADIHERDVFYNSFYSWITGLLGHATQITGYVTKSEWLPQSDIPQQNILQGSFLSP